MNRSGDLKITQALKDWNDGKEDAQDRLLPYVYEELKRQARYLMSRERSDHTLQPTALVHEAFMRLAKQSGVEWQNRAHFFGISSRLMRQILVDHARGHAAEKRGNNAIHYSLDDIDIPVEQRAEAIIMMNETLARLEDIDEQQAKVVEMRFFGGLSNREIAEALGVSERTVTRELKVAKLWLFRELNK